MSNNLEEAINEIRQLRWSILPPYCENLDEDEKSTADYVDYFSSEIDRCIAASAQYLEAVSQLADADVGDSLRIVIAARSLFVESFPFCTDELNLLKRGRFKGLSKFFDRHLCQGSQQRFN